MTKRQQILLRKKKLHQQFKIKSKRIKQKRGHAAYLKYKQQYKLQVDKLRESLNLDDKLISTEGWMALVPETFEDYHKFWKGKTNAMSWLVIANCHEPSLTYMSRTSKYNFSGQ